MAGYGGAAFRTGVVTQPNSVAVTNVNTGLAATDGSFTFAVEGIAQ